MNSLSTTSYGNHTLGIETRAATHRRKESQSLPISSNEAAKENNLVKNKQQYSIQNMSGNEFRAMTNELYERGEISPDTHKNMIRSLLFSTKLDVTGLGAGVQVQGTQLDDQNKKIDMLAHFETVLSEKKENIKKYNFSYDIKPFEQVVTTLKQLTEKYNSPRIDIIA